MCKYIQRKTLINEKLDNKVYYFKDVQNCVKGSFKINF
jgi:hypothetical protein